MYRPTFVSEPMSNPQSKRKADGAATLLRQLCRKPYVWLLAATHRELFHSANQEIVEDVRWPMGLALLMLGAVALLLAVVSHIFVNSVEHAATAFDMTPAFVGFVIVALMSGVPEMVSGWSAARKNQLDLSIGIALGGATQLALFVAPLLVLSSYFIGPAPMTLQFWPAAVAMVLVASIIAWMATNSGISAWFVGAFLVMVYGVFAMSLYVLPPE